MLAFRSLIFSISIFSTFAISTLVRQSPSTFVVLEQRSSPPGGFVYNGPADPNLSLKITLGLTSNDMIGLEKALYDVESFSGPSAQTKAAVLQWLENNGINATKSSSSGEWVSFNTTVLKANTLFDTKYNVYTQEATGKEVVQTLSISIPSALAQCIEVIRPSTQFPTGKLAQLTSFGATSSNTGLRSGTTLTPSQPAPDLQQDSNIPPHLSVCNVSEIVPDCILALYGIPTDVPPQNKSTITVSGFLDQFVQKSDLRLFLTTFSTHINPATTFSLQTIDGGQDLQNISDAGVEANLDIEYTVGLAKNVPVNFFSVGDNFTDGDLNGLLNMMTDLLAEEVVPGVLTTSYSSDEEDIVISHARKFCNAAMQLTARGTSIFFSSGDGGVGGGGDVPSCTTFVPTFPAGCPYITSVGGTMGIAPETAAGLSSGGFSNYFPRPWYQETAVDGYLKKLKDTNAGLYNLTGRGYPDVSAQSVLITVISGGRVERGNGTSASTPIFASLVAEVNAVRLRQGKQTLGFLNPLIYAIPELLTDITSGSNPGCNTSGFPALTGWDPVTGLGSPSFERFVELP